MIRVCIRFIAPSKAFQSFTLCNTFSSRTNVGHWLRWASRALDQKAEDKYLFSGRNAKPLGPPEDYKLEVQTFQPV